MSKIHDLAEYAIKTLLNAENTDTFVIKLYAVSQCDQKNRNHDLAQQLSSAFFELDVDAFIAHINNQKSDIVIKLIELHKDSKECYVTLKNTQPAIIPSFAEASANAKTALNFIIESISAANEGCGFNFHDAEQDPKAKIFGTNAKTLQLKLNANDTIEIKRELERLAYNTVAESHSQETNFYVCKNVTNNWK